MQSPSPMPLSAKKIPTSSRLAPCMLILCHLINKPMESVRETLMLQMANVTRNAESLMSQTRKWKLRMMTTRGLKTRLHVRLVALFEYVGFTIHYPKAATPSTMPQQVSMPTTRLLCTNLPQEVTEDVLAVLFQQYASINFLIFFGVLTVFQTSRVEINAGYVVTHTQCCRCTG
jgi:hypothetical protein